MIGPRNGRTPKGLFIDRKSVGTVWINGVPHTYNANLVYDHPVTVDQIIEDSQPRKKKVILIRRK